VDTVVPTKENVIECPIGGIADADRKHSLPEGVCHSIGDQSPGTLVESINPFGFPDVILIKVKTFKIKLSKLKKKGLTVDLKN
jgi:hypothetical protein